MNNFEIIFYIGVGFIILFFVMLLKLRFEEDDKIDLSEHYILITTYIFIIIVAIFTWRYLFDLLFYKGLSIFSTPTMRIE